MDQLNRTPPMNTETGNFTAHTEVDALLRSWLAAVLASDLERIVSHYASDVVAFDAIKALQFKGADAYGKHWADCMAMCPGQMLFEMHELRIVAADDVAYCHYLAHCGVTDPSGETKSGYTRATVGCRKVNGKWVIAHEHFSAPFDMETGKALHDLKP
jgi:uncharacterized protein (TIGR02246 family)